MKRVLIVKITSLGDEVFAQPLVADLKRAYPGVRIDWFADEYCAEVCRWNPDIDRVISAPLRAIKKDRSWANVRAILGAIRALRKEKYDAVIDIHGVYKSAIAVALTRSTKRYGYPDHELGEGGSAFAYTDRLAGRAPEDNFCQRARVRRAVSRAFGYPITDKMEYGLQLPEPEKLPEQGRKGPFALIFHATSDDAKKWPPERWIEVGKVLNQRGLRVLVPWGSESERRDAELLVAGMPNAELMARMSVLDCSRMVNAADVVLGTDTGFVHIGEALGKPVIMVFNSTSQHYYGVQEPGRVVALGGDGVTPSTAEVLAALEEVYPTPALAPAVAS